MAVISYQNMTTKQNFSCLAFYSGYQFWHTYHWFTVAALIYCTQNNY